MRILARGIPFLLLSMLADAHPAAADCRVTEIATGAISTVQISFPNGEPAGSRARIRSLRSFLHAPDEAMFRAEYLAAADGSAAPDEVAIVLDAKDRYATYGDVIWVAQEELYELETLRTILRVDARKRQVLDDATDRPVARYEDGGGEPCAPADALLGAFTLTQPGKLTRYDREE